MKRASKTSIPIVSIIMANYRGERFLEASIQSVLTQSLTSLELIVSDDGSDDASVEIVSRIGRNDLRVRLLTGTENTGPAATRNRALAVARGEWIAIMDSDDVMRPRRLQSLISLAQSKNCEISADDLFYIDENGNPSGETLLADATGRIEDIVSADVFIETEVAGSELPKLGYLKPIIRRSCLNGIAYNEALRVGEDFDFLLRLLLKGARLAVTQNAFYLYRRHGSSISHRLSEQKVSAMLAAQTELEKEHAGLPANTSRLLKLRRAELERQLAYERLVRRVKSRDIAGAARSLLARPALAKELALSLRENLSRRMSQ